MLSLKEDLKKQREKRADGDAQMLKTRNPCGIPSTMGYFLQAGMSTDETVDLTLHLLKYNPDLCHQTIKEDWIRKKAQGMCDLLLWGNKFKSLKYIAKH